MDCMMLDDAARRLPRIESQVAWTAAGVAVLVMVGYGAGADLRMSVALVGAVALVALAAVSYQHPRAAIAACFVMVLLAGTKFRMREASDSLDGSMDAQILFELALFAAVGVAVLAGWIAAGDRRPAPHLKMRPTYVEVLLGGYAGIALLSTLWSAAPMLTLVRAGQLLVVSAMAIASVRMLTPAAALWAGCASVAVYSIGCSVIGPTFPWSSEFADASDRIRFAWFSVHPIAVGTLTGIAALGLLSTAFWTSPHRTGRLLGIPLYWHATPLVIILVMTNSRGPLLAFVAGVCTLAFLRLRSPARIPLMLVAAASMLVMVAIGPNLQAWIFSASTQSSALNDFFFQGQSTEGLLGLNGRLDLWTDLAPAMAAHPVLGYGYQASRATLLDVASWAGYAHNALMQTILDLGIAGTAALGLLVAVASSAAIRPRLAPWLRGTSAALMVFLVLNSVGTESFAGAPGFETLLLFVCALSVESSRRAASRAATPL
jgi:O-antigen ligase